MFSLHEFTKVKILEVVTLSQKNRPPGANPGVRIDFRAKLSNSMLSEFDGALLGWLYTKAESSEPIKDKDRRQTLPGVEAISDKPNLTSIGRNVKRLPWAAKFTGYTSILDHGLGGASNLVLTDCTIDRVRFIAFEEGGTFELSASIYSYDVPKPTYAELGVLKSREVPIQLREPEVKQQEIEADPAAEKAWPFPKTPEQLAREQAAPKRGSKAAKQAAKSATEEFLGQHGTAEA